MTRSQKDDGGDGSRRRGIVRAALTVAAFVLAAATATAADAPLKIGLVTTLSGPGGYLGQDVRDGFKLAVSAENGALGGRPVDVLVEDDGLKPGQGKQIVDRMLANDGVKLFTGIVFTNVAVAALPDILDAGAFFVSANAGPSNYAGADCAPNYFVVSWLTDTMQGSAGQNATDLGYHRAMVVAPNYQAGKEAVEGFTRFFKGEIVREMYTRLDQTDFSAEMAAIRASMPDVVFQFEPGGLGIAFMRQYQQAGLLGSVPMVVAEPSLDHTTLAAVGEAAIGVQVSGHWNSDFDNPSNKDFLARFTQAYGRAPTMYAAQGYDTGLAIAAALRATGGSLDDAAAFRRAMARADFASTRGAFAFGTNQNPVQDWWAFTVQRGPDGKPALVTRKKLLTAYVDPFAASCRLPPAK